MLFLSQPCGCAGKGFLTHQTTVARAMDGFDGMSEWSMLRPAPRKEMDRWVGHFLFSCARFENDPDLLALYADGALCSLYTSNWFTNQTTKRQ